MMADKEKAIFRVFIRGTVDAVWREVTKTHEPQQCFFNMYMRTDGLQRGGQIRMRSRNGKYTTVIGEILEFDPPRRFSHTFRFTNFDDPWCKVIYDLEEVEGGVQFTMTLEDLPTGTKTASQMKQGGNLIVNTLKSMVETGKPSFGTRLLFVLIRTMQPFTPKRCRSENWPLPSETRTAV